MCLGLLSKKDAFIFPSKTRGGFGSLLIQVSLQFNGQGNLEKSKVLTGSDTGMKRSQVSFILIEMSSS